MPYLTISEYARLKQVTRQAIEDRIKRGTLAIVERPVKKVFIPVDDTEMGGVNVDSLREARARRTL